MANAQCHAEIRLEIAIANNSSGLVWLLPRRVSSCKEAFWQMLNPFPGHYLRHIVYIHLERSGVCKWQMVVGLFECRRCAAGLLPPRQPFLVLQMRATCPTGEDCYTYTSSAQVYVNVAFIPPAHPPRIGRTFADICAGGRCRWFWPVVRARRCRAHARRRRGFCAGGRC